ncbi:molybdopterin-dependent oxidoreductase [Candidatus Pantoea persica]|uniref:molybdopterin-dependent oxidoreductase n=1 Tax=Candidatus Pantoea persica TaxID=2518128 RepID=UPI00215DA7AD|nr:molybdopterin-dependent oxidoreductase [Candidatus Pantoea persica]
MVTRLCGTPQEDFLAVCQQFASTSVRDRTATLLYALGWTHHTNGLQIIRTAAMIQLLLGNIGMPGGGINALRGHSNVQGYTDLGLLWQSLTGYLPLLSEKIAALPNQVNYWQNTDKFFISLMKCFYDDNATQENQWSYDWLPKWDKSYDCMAQAEMMEQGAINGCLVQSFNLLAAFPDKNKACRALSRLKYMVVIDPLSTETASFWQPHGEFNDVDPAQIATEVFRLPSSCFAEEEGSVANSSRWLQWHWAAGRGAARRSYSRNALFAPARAVPRGRRRGAGAADGDALGLQQPCRSVAGRGGEGEQRPGAARRLRRQRQATAEKGPAAALLRRAAQRRQHRQRLLDLRRQLDARQQPDGAPRQRRSFWAGRGFRLGLGLAGEPPHSL